MSDRGDTQEIKTWPDAAATMYYCELCEQLYVSYDVFYEHRMDSDYDVQGDPERFLDYQELSEGDEIPENATVGRLEPCEPMEATH